nr:MAG TPA: hypothetical protein [Caudoviricetes sp.]
MYHIIKYFFYFLRSLFIRTTYLRYIIICK